MLKSELHIASYFGSNISLIKTLWIGNKLLITCANTREAYLVKSKCDGTLYNGQKIVVHYVHRPSDVTGSSNASGGSGGGQESDLITKLKQIIQSKYDPANFYLDLEHFTSAGFSQEPSKTNFGRVLCKLIGEICPDVSPFLCEPKEMDTFIIIYVSFL